MCSFHSGNGQFGEKKGTRNAVKHSLHARPEMPGFTEGAARSIDEKMALLVARRNASDRWLMTEITTGEDSDLLRVSAAAYPCEPEDQTHDQPSGCHPGRHSYDCRPVRRPAGRSER